MKISMLTKLSQHKLNHDIPVKALNGLHKKSFAMYFGGGEIWFEHLDSMYTLKDEVIKKFNNDLPNITKPSKPSLIAVNLDETLVDEEIVEVISNAYIKNERYIRKLVFVGLHNKSKRLMDMAFKKRKSDYRFVINYINDFEKAKEWLVK